MKITYHLNFLLLLSILWAGRPSYYQIIKVLTMTNKELRKLLNDKYPGRHDASTGFRNGNWGNHKRGYGDYLWFQDRVMFDDVKRRCEENGPDSI